MKDTLVNNCTGTFMDSDNGTPASNYGHNENYTFTICTPGAAQLVMTFSSFCTEQGLDIIRFFDGPDTNATLILAHSGSNIPGPIIANSGCLTIHFRSDANIACTGWIANWSTTLNPPVSPVFTGATGITCYATSIELQLDQPIPCDSVYPSAFTISGPGNPVIINATAMPCSNGTTTNISLQLNPAFSLNGNYNLNFSYYFKDICDSIWHFDIPYNFSISDCPITAEIISDKDTICLGECVNITGLATGGDSTTYTYIWSNGLPASAGPHAVCPAVTTTYSLIVDDAGPSPADTAYKTIVVVPQPNAGADTAYCESHIPIMLAGSPSGGFWTGAGIDSSGLFDPSVAGGGIHQILYEVNGCADTVIINITPINAGPDEGACPGIAPFQFSGFYPAGGIWSGPKVTTAGMFTPDSVGVYILNYSVNGCIDTKTVFVDTLAIQNADTLCINISQYYLAASPAGGIWSGPGLINSSTGEMDPAAAGLGLKQYIYTINGCSDTVDIFIQQINAGPNRTSCPSQVPFTLPAASPAGGFWSGTGIIDSATGLFDPGANNGNNFTSYLIYDYNGCIDTMIMYVRKTNVGADTLYFCEADSVLLLNWDNTQRTPSNGNWSGPGVTDPNFPGTFDPAVAGPGVHKLYYNANTCGDSLIMVVYEIPQVQQDTATCVNSPAFVLNASPTGGLWTGTGIINSTSGTFDPGQSGTGSFDIFYETFSGCIDSMTVNITSLPIIDFTSIDSIYCLNNVLHALSASPTGGNYAGPGIFGNSFNPKAAGSGDHYITYSTGSGFCEVRDSMKVNVRDTLALNFTNSYDTICFGESITLFAVAAGGDPDGYSFIWNNGQYSGDTIIVSPPNSTVYSVILNDGCSQADTATVFIHVYPPLQYNVSTSPKICYGDTGFAKVNAVPGADYDYIWHTTPVTTGDSLAAVKGAYLLTISDTITGCSLDTTVTIPGYNFIQANFSISPEVACISQRNAEALFIDLSVGGLNGWWSFGDGDSIPYILGQNPYHMFNDIGEFVVTLYIENEGNCPSVATDTICIRPESKIFAPNVFSPNNDGVNDLFKITSSGLIDARLSIYNRWGEKVFETTDLDEGWDGQYNGTNAPLDTYIYIIQYHDHMTTLLRKHQGYFILLR